MDWNKAIEFANLVNAAYALDAGTPPITTGYVVLAKIYANDLATDRRPERGKQRVTIGLILQARGSGEAIVAIRGTAGIKEWVQDAQFGDTPFRRVPGAGRTEDGFTAMYESMTIEDGPGVRTVVKGLQDGVKWNGAITSLTICGHSLGGALATMLAIDVAANCVAPFNKPLSYTYASPKTGDQDFANKYAQLVETTYRFVDNVDIVPKGPPEASYKHICPEIELVSLQVLPLPIVRLQPNPYCWHILSSYLHLMSVYSGGPKIPADQLCAVDPLTVIEGLIEKVKDDLRNDQALRDKFEKDARTDLGGHSKTT